MNRSSNRLWNFFTGGSLLRRTLLSVTGFGLGSLLIAGLLSLASVGVAESLLPAAPSEAEPVEGEAPAAAASKDRETLADGRHKPRARRRPATRPSLPMKPPSTAGDRPL